VDVGHKNTLQHHADPHDAEQSCARDGDEHEDAGAREPHFEAREELRPNAQDELEQRIHFLCTARDERDGQEGVDHAEQQDRDREEQEIGLVPIDRQVLLAGAPPAAPARRDAASQERAERRVPAVAHAPLDVLCHGAAVDNEV